MKDTTFYFYRESPPHRLTADKMEIRNFLDLPAATSFIRQPLSEIGLNMKNN